MAGLTLGLALFRQGKEFDDVPAALRGIETDLRKAWEGEVGFVGAALRDYLDRVAQAVADRHSGAWPGGTTDSTLSRRTGRLTAGIIKSVKVRGKTLDTLEGSIGGGVRYLAIHEFGGTISARGKLLTIPLPAALTSRGTSALFSRAWKNTFVAKSRAGNLIIFQRRGREIVPLYVLKSSVTIPARLGLRKEMEAQLPYFVGKLVDSLMADLLEKAMLED